MLEWAVPYGLQKNPTFLCAPHLKTSNTTETHQTVFNTVFRSGLVQTCATDLRH